MNYKNMTIGERVRARRKELKFTQRTLASALKISHVSVSQWERDDSEPTGKNLHSLSKILKCSPTWILFGDEDSEPSAYTEERPPLDERQQELLDLFDALPVSEQDGQLMQMRARVKNNETLLNELLEARKRAQRKK